MSNLGMYQTMTTLAKKLGGPRNLGISTLATGAIGEKLIEVSIKKAYRLVRGRRSLQTADKTRGAARTYEVLHTAETESGLRLREGDRFRVLERDEDAVLIEPIAGADNPHIVSSSVLESLSDFK